jgi:hypothetical protein
MNLARSEAMKRRRKKPELRVQFLAGSKLGSEVRRSQRLERPHTLQDDHQGDQQRDAGNGPA